MKEHPNRMDADAPKRKRGRPRKNPLPERPRGIPCPYCDTVGQHQVRTIFDHRGEGVRLRRRTCDSCRRSFTTRETAEQDE
jgi:hypothetical protein